jgi:mRNA interferase MazF
MLSAIAQAQFPHLDSLIHIFVGGSELHGAKVKDTDDLDIYGIYLEPPELFLVWRKKTFLCGALLETSAGTDRMAPVYTGGTGLLTQVSVGTEDGLKHASWITCDDLMSVRKSDLTHFVGSLSRAKIAELNRALAVALELL